MKLIKAIAVIGACTVAIAAALSYADVHAAETVVDGAKTPALFQCDGKPCSPTEAALNYKKYSIVVRCQPKVMQTPDGKEVSICAGGYKPVFKHVNPINGNETWKTTK